jgi:16S rRNA U516 pseudouridylate synthase RsuA-like enzyme
VRIVGPKLLRVVLKQGIKRQIRLMLYRLGYEVERLRRIRMAGVTDFKLPPGAWRPLTAKELDLLAKAAQPAARQAHARKRVR